MAQTKRKRRSKHRGTAAGSIQTRGRTGRPPTAEERKKADRAKTREDRLAKPPTWKQSLTRAAFGAALLFLFLLLTSKGKNKVEVAIVFAIVALAIYVPAGYYIELLLWKRRQRSKAAKK